MIKGENQMNYKIEQWPMFRVMGISYRIKTSKAFEIVPQIWERPWLDQYFLNKVKILNVYSLICCLINIYVSERS